MSKNLGIISSIALMSSLSFSISANVLANNNDTVDSMMRTGARYMNNTLPMMVDSETRLDSTVGMYRTFRYNYTLVNLTAFDITAKDIKHSLENKLFNSVCTAPALQMFVENNVTVTYSYFGNRGRHITDISIDSSQC